MRGHAAQSPLSPQLCGDGSGAGHSLSLGCSGLAPCRGASPVQQDLDGELLVPVLTVKGISDPLRVQATPAGCLSPPGSTPGPAEQHGTPSRRDSRPEARAQSPAQTRPPAPQGPPAPAPRGRILGEGEGDADLVVPDGVEHPQVLAHAHEALRGELVDEALPKGGCLREKCGICSRERPGAGGGMPSASPRASSASSTHPQQGFLSLRLVLVASRLDALAHRLREQLLVLDLPQVLVCLLALLLQGSTARGGDLRARGRPPARGSPGTTGPPSWGRRQVWSRAGCRTSYSFCASNRRAPGAMEAILKISWLASAGGERKKHIIRGCPRAGATWGCPSAAPSAALGP